MAKTDIRVNFDDNNSVKNVIQKTIKALRQADKHIEAEMFQRELCSTSNTLMDIVSTYVIII